MDIDLRFRNWELVLESASVRQYDDHIHAVSVTGDYPEGWRWYLYISVNGENYLNIIPLQEDDGALSALLTRDDLAFGDTIYTLQLAGEREERTRYCNPVRLYVGGSLSGDAVWPELPARFTQAQQAVEAAANAAAESARQAAETAESIDTDLSGMQTRLTQIDAALSGKQGTALVGQAYSSELPQYVTPAQVFAALSEGRDVTVRYLDSVYGVLVFTAWNVAESMNIVLANSIVYYNNMYLLYELAGAVTESGGVWSRVAAPLQQGLDFDDAPAASSQNPVKSGGVYTALQGKAAALDLEGHATDTDLHLTAHERVRWDGYGTTLQHLGADLDDHVQDAAAHITAAERAAWNAKPNASAIPAAGTSAPAMDGAAAAGASASYARADHVHPTDTSRLSATGNAYRALSIPFGQVDDTSTATAFTATVPGITELRDGVCVYLRNGRVTSAAGFTININGLGAKPVYQTLAAAGAVTTLFNVNYTMLFIYNSTRVSGGCWDMFYGYNSNTTYTNMTQSEADAGTATTARTISAKVLSARIRGLLPAKTSELENDSGFVTQSEMELAIAAAGGGSSDAPTLLGQTPLKLTDAAAILLLSGEGTCEYALQSDTVADFDLLSGTATNAAVTRSDGVYRIQAASAAGAWYQSYVDVPLSGLTAGETYTLVFDAAGCTYDEQTHQTVGHFILYDGGGNTLVTRGASDTNRLNSYAFTAPTANVRLRWYPATNSTFVSGASVGSVNRVYIDRAGATAHTPVVSLTGSFTGTTTLRGVPAGVTVTASPACAVYSGSEASPAAAKPLAGKTVVCFGDSLFGMYRGETSAPAYVADTTGATVYNVGFGGCRMANHPTSGYAEFSMWALSKAIADGDWSAQDAAAAQGSDYFPEQLAALKAIDFNTVDYAVIHYGTNDFGGGVALGENSAASDHTTLCGALRYSIETLLGAYPKLRLFVSLPVFRCWTSGGVTTDSDTYRNAQSKTLPEYAEAMRAVAREYHVPVIDGYNGLGVNGVNAPAFYTDGTHHNETGRRRFGTFIGAQLAAMR